MNGLGLIDYLYFTFDNARGIEICVCKINNNGILVNGEQEISEIFYSSVPYTCVSKVEWRYLDASEPLKLKTDIWEK